VNLRLRLLIGAVVVLAVALPVAIAVAVWRSGTPRGGVTGGPSAPPLSAVSADQDRAVAAVLSAVGERAAVAVTSAVPVRSCTVGGAHGSVYARSADLYLDPGGEDALIGTVAAALPSEYRRQTGADRAPLRHATPRGGAATGGGAAPFTAQVGGSVTLTVAQLGEGWVRATAQSDCRTAGSTSAPVPAGSAAAAIAVLLNSLGTAPDSMHANVLPCNGSSGGGETVTWAAVSGTVDSGQIQNRLAPAVPPTARRFASPANRLPWRDGHTSVIVAASDDGTHVTVQYTVDCS
jgi:hypothetical protein